MLEKQLVMYYPIESQIASDSPKLQKSQENCNCLIWLGNAGIYNILGDHPAFAFRDYQVLR